LETRLVSAEKTVRDIMTKNVITVDLDTPASEIIKKMVTKEISGIAVLDFSGDLVGVVSGLDIFKLLKEDSFDKMMALTAENVMTPFTINIDPDTPLTEAATILLENGIHRLIVTTSPSHKKPIGLVSSTDILRELANMFDSP